MYNETEQLTSKNELQTISGVNCKAESTTTFGGVVETRCTTI